MRGRDARILHGERLVAEQEIYMDWEVPEVDRKRPFCCDVLEGKPFMFRSVEDWTRIELHVLTVFLRVGGQSWVLEGFWPQVEILTGNCAATCDFKRNREHISVTKRSLNCFVA